MESTRWWSVAIAAVTVVLVAILVTGDLAPATLAVGATGVLLLPLGWILLGRHAFDDGWQGRVLLVALPVAAGLGVCGHPSIALIQCVAYPLAWMITNAVRPAIIANVAIALAVFLGFVVRLGPGEGLVVGGFVSVLSLGFAISLGLWITRIATQSDERKRLLDELQAAQEKLSRLDREAGITSERERLAREIHDTIAQDLTGLVLLAQRAQRESDPSASLALLEESARTALAETRALVAASAPVALASGITDALERLGERFERETSVSVAVTADLPPLDRDTEVVLLRCAQEGLANVRKHAQASAVALGAWGADGSVALRVADDGTGFDAEGATDGYGLVGLRDRLALVGGTLEVSSSPAGTVLTATLPVHA